MDTIDDYLFQKVPEDMEYGVEVRVNDKLVQHDEANGSNRDYKLSAGVLIEHRAVHRLPILGVTWFVEGFPSATVAYFPYSTWIGAKININATSLTQNPLRFGWWQPGRYTVICVMVTAAGASIVTHRFTMDAPLVRDFSGSTGTVGVGNYRGTEMIRLVKSLQEFGRDGLQQVAVLAGTQTHAGTIAGIQLASNQRFCTHRDGSNWRQSTNNNYVLDTGVTDSVFYQNHMVPIGNDGQNVNWEMTDGPGIGLNHNIIKSVAIGDRSQNPPVPESYFTYLMFRPDSVGTNNSVWIPLKVIEWNWMGSTFTRDGQWVPAQNTGQDIGEATDATYPFWYSNTGRSQWVPV